MSGGFTVKVGQWRLDSTVQAREPQQWRLDRAGETVEVRQHRLDSWG